jgi:hypothetical protein
MAINQIAIQGIEDEGQLAESIKRRVHTRTSNVIEYALQK